MTAEWPFRDALRVGYPSPMLRLLVCLSLMGALLAACTATASPSAPPIATASPTGTSAPSAPVATATSEATPEPTPTATPDRANVPLYTAGAMIETFAPGLRARARPGTDQRTIGQLPEGADLLVVMGPVWVDDYGWYQVQDSDAADPQFDVGWVAAGFEPDPFLAPTVFDLSYNPYIAGFAHDADGEFGPVRIADSNHGIRWMAAPFSSAGCSFAVDLVPPSGEAVRTIRSTVGAIPAPGELSFDFFVAHPELSGDLFVAVTSDCSWALTFVRFQG